MESIISRLQQEEERSEIKEKVEELLHSDSHKEKKKKQK
jgi:hypothetical protein